MLFASMVFMNITDLCYSSSGKIKLYFDPQAVDIPAAKPDQRINFTVDVYVSNIEDVYAYQIVIKYNTTFLDIYDIEFPPGYIFEGLPVVELDKIIGPGYVIVGRTLLGVTSGVTVPAGEAKILVRLLCSIGMNGTTYLRIATVDKPVIREGLYEAYTYFIDSSLNKIDISSSNADIGICRVTAGLKAPPYAEFEVSPANPIVYRIAILNASKSFDPDGYIAYYYWNITHRDFYFIINTTDPVTYYNFTYPGTYNVTLSVVDNDNLTGTITYEVKVVCQVYYIRADGSIDPPDAPIISHDNITYYLTSNIKFCGGIIIQKNNITLNGKGFQIEGTGEWGTRGIKLSNRRNVTIKNIGISKFGIGILCWFSSNIKISSISVTQCHNGIYLYWSDNVDISRNNMLMNFLAVYILSSSFNVISKNIILLNKYGISPHHSSYNIIMENVIAMNRYGMAFVEAYNNTIYHNNFIYNIKQVWDLSMLSPTVPPSFNIWDIGYPSGGNYWSDYNGTDFYSGPYQNKTGSDGIGDTPYVIYENNLDRYPLMSPIVNANVNFNPEALNLRSRGRWIIAYIELPQDYDAASINVSTIMLDGTVPVDVNASVVIGDYDNDTVPDLMVCFNWTEVADYILSKGIVFGNVTLEVSGKLYNGTIFTGTDTILVSSLVGDVNVDGKVDIGDLSLAAMAFGSYPNHPRWNPNANFNENLEIDIMDIALTAQNYGKHA